MPIWASATAKQSFIFSIYFTFFLNNFHSNGVPSEFFSLFQIMIIFTLLVCVRKTKWRFVVAKQPLTFTISLIYYFSLAGVYKKGLSREISQWIIFFLFSLIIFTQMVCIRKAKWRKCHSKAILDFSNLLDLFGAKSEGGKYVVYRWAFQSLI